MNVLRVVTMALGLLALGSVSARAYKRATVDGTTDIYLYWSVRRVDYYVNHRGSEDVSLQEALGAIRRSFFTWAAPSCTDVYFNFAGMTTTDRSNLSSPQSDPDKKNVIIWREEAWPPAGATDDGSVTSDMAALTVIVYNADSGEIIDADIDLNGHDFFWTTTDDKTKSATDVQNVVTHEAGHLIGFAHSSVPEATMFGATPQGELDKRVLHQDDLDALCTVYPYDAPTPLGPDQPSPKGEVQGATGCAAAGGATARAGAVTALLFFALAALALAGARALRRRRRRAR
ncbi:MAG: matrixin family metalloprotease [Myxococcales bacterium]|nr:matrixin family metalloprotease [Myxococcales bacterium]